MAIGRPTVIGVVDPTFCSAAIIDTGSSRALMTVSGHIDAQCARRLRHRVTDLALLGIERIDLDMGAVTFFGVDGVGALMSAAQELRGRGRIRVVAPSPVVARSLEVAALLEFFTAPPAPRPAFDHTVHRTVAS